MNITLTPDIEEALSKKASKDGVSLEEFVLNILRKQAAPKNEVEVFSDGNRTMYDLFKDHIGVISSSEMVPGGANMSVDCGKKFAEGMMEKKKIGKL